MDDTPASPTNIQIELKEGHFASTPTQPTPAAETPRSSSARKPRISSFGAPTIRSTEAIYRIREPSYTYKPWSENTGHIDIPDVDTTQPTEELADLQEGELSFLKMLFRTRDTVLPEILT